MRFLKLIFISAVVLFIIATCIGLLLPSTVVVSRVADVHAPKDSVLPMITNLNNWKLWINGMDKEGVKIISTTEADLMGTRVTITNTSDTLFQTLWKGKKGELQNSNIRFITNPSTPNTVTVQWEFIQEVQWYPWERLGSIMNDKILGVMMEKNLDNLKKVIEKK